MVDRQYLFYPSAPPIAEVETANLMQTNNGIVVGCDEIRRSLPYPYPPPLSPPPPPRRSCLRSLVSCGCWVLGVFVTTLVLANLVDVPSHTRMVSKWVFSIAQTDRMERIPTTHSIHAQELKRLVLHHFPQSSVFTTDNLYHVPEEGVMRDWLRDDNTDSYAYRPERHDCDDFSAILIGNLRKWEYENGGNHSFAVGQAFGTNGSGEGHAYNIVVTVERFLFFIEPQSDAMVTPTRFGYNLNAVLF